MEILFSLLAQKLVENPKGMEDLGSLRFHCLVESVHCLSAAHLGFVELRVLICKGQLAQGL